jgi:hypothetical protein
MARGFAQICRNQQVGSGGNILKKNRGNLKKLK